MNLQNWDDPIAVVNSVHAPEREDGAGSIVIQPDIRYGTRSRKTVAIQIIGEDGEESDILTVYASDLLKAVSAMKAASL